MQIKKVLSPDPKIAPSTILAFAKFSELLKGSINNPYVVNRHNTYYSAMRRNRNLLIYSLV